MATWYIYSMERGEKFFSGISWLLIVLVLVLTALAISYLGPKEQVVVSPTTTAQPTHEPRDYNVFYKAGVFAPTNIRIHASDSVKFENQSFASIRIISDSIAGKLLLADFDSKTEIAPGNSFTYKFLKVGTFGYHNIDNPDESGSVTVRP